MTETRRIKVLAISYKHRTVKVSDKEWLKVSDDIDLNDFEKNAEYTVKLQDNKITEIVRENSNGTENHIKERVAALEQKTEEIVKRLDVIEHKINTYSLNIFSELKELIEHSIKEQAEQYKNIIKFIKGVQDE